jgi:hypothetical protein
VSELPTGRTVPLNTKGSLLNVADVSAGLFTDDIEVIAELIDAALLSLVRTQCGLRRLYGLPRVLRPRVRRRLTCEIPDRLRLGRTDDLRIQHP